MAYVTLSIVVLIAGAFIGEVWIKTLFVLAVTVASGGWRGDGYW